jgi:hypothetical protein
MVLEGKVKARVLGLRQRAVDDGGLVGSLQCKRSTRPLFQDTSIT